MEMSPDHDFNLNSIDEQVGRNIRRRREALGLSRVSLSRMIGCSPAQFVAFEQGAQRVDAATMAALSRALSCRVTLFFDDSIDRGDLDPVNE